MPDLSVVIPVRNGADDLGAQLRELAEQCRDRSVEVIVVDNGSTDATAEVAESFRGSLPALEIVDASETVGPSAARNRGVEAASGEAVAFLDADDQIMPGYLDALAVALGEHPFVAARLDFRALNSNWVARSRPPFQADGLLDPFGFLPSGGGGTIAIARELLERHGGFDPTMSYGEDIDLCWRLQLAGVPLVFVPDAVLRCQHRDTLRGLFRQARGYGSSGPLLWRRYRSAGMRRRSARGAVRFWGGLVTRLVRIRTRADLAAYVFVVGYRIGVIRGCIRARALYL